MDHRDVAPRGADAHMEHALRLAEAALPGHDPNPRVGCVVVRDGEVVGTGAHRGAGSPHAEVVALAVAGEQARGATAFVTLEPCSHTGRTGPCVEALTAAGITRVVYGSADRTEEAAGGAAALRRAGIDTLLHPIPGLEHLNRRWETAVRRGRPWVTAKTAISLDGRIAAADGSSRWITGEQARADVHRLRTRVGAVVTGTGTVLADDPLLTARPDGRTVDPQPIPVVVGRRGVPDGAALAARPDLIRIAEHDPTRTLQQLAARQIRRVLLECGPTLLSAWLRAGVVDELVVYQAPVLLGGGRTVTTDLGVADIAAALRWRTLDRTVLGEDLRLTLEPAPQEEH